MSEFVPVARVGEIAEGTGRTVEVAGRPIALFFVRGRYYAVDDYCPHMGASLGAGEIHDGMVICNRHMWAFRLADGTCADVPALSVETFEVRVEGDEVLVRVPDAS